MLEANRDGMLGNLEVKPGRAIMVVDAETWSAAAFPIKMAIVETYRCVLTRADRSKTTRIEVRDNMNNQVVGEYDGENLTIP
jgi:hypothetical protein